MKYLLLLREEELDNLIAVVTGQIMAIERKLSRTPITAFVSPQGEKEYAVLKYRLEQLKALRVKLLSAKGRGSING